MGENSWSKVASSLLSSPCTATMTIPTGYGALRGRGKMAFIGLKSQQWLAFAVVCSLFPLVVLGAGNCSSLASTTLLTGALQMDVTGPSLTMRLLRNGAIYEGASITYSADRVVERARDAVATQAPQACVQPATSLGLTPSQTTTVSLDCLFAPAPGCFVDPLMPYQAGVSCSGSAINQTCGAVYSSLAFLDMNCWAEHINSTVDGFLVETLRVNFADPDSAFTATILYQLPKADFTYFPLDTNPAVFFNYAYVPWFCRAVFVLSHFFPSALAYFPCFAPALTDPFCSSARIN